VVDASVVAAYILKEPGWESLEAYMVEAVSVGLLVLEVINAIWKALHRGLIDKEDAREKVRILMMLVGTNIIIRDESEILDLAIEIAFSQNVTIYDAVYIALAEKLDAELVTFDRKQYGACIAEGVRCELLS